MEEEVGTMRQLEALFESHGKQLDPDDFGKIASMLRSTAEFKKSQKLKKERDEQLAKMMEKKDEEEDDDSDAEIDIHTIFDKSSEYKQDNFGWIGEVKYNSAQLCPEVSCL